MTGAAGVNESGAGAMIILPAFQEEKTVAGVIAEVRRALPDAEIVVVNDGSADRTTDQARTAGATVIDLPFNLGIGGAVQAGLRYARRRGLRLAVQVDSDGQHPAEQIARLLGPIRRNEADLVIGSRFLEPSALVSSQARRVGIAMLSNVLWLLAGIRVHDVTSGFRAFGGAAIELLADRYPEDYPEPESILILHQSGRRIVEVPVRMRQRQGGHSSITGIRTVYYMIKVSLALLVDRLRRAQAGRVFPRR